MYYHTLLQVKPFPELLFAQEYVFASNDFNKHALKVADFTFGPAVDAVDARIAIASALNDYRLSHRAKPTKDDTINMLSATLGVFRVASRYYLNEENMRDLNDFLSLYSYYTHRLLEAEIAAQTAL